MKCSKCGHKVAEHITGMLSCACSEHRIGSFAPYPPDWSRRGYRKWEKRKQEVRAAEHPLHSDDGDSLAESELSNDELDPLFDII